MTGKVRKIESRREGRTGGGGRLEIGEVRLDEKVAGEKGGGYRKGKEEEKVGRFPCQGKS